MARKPFQENGLAGLYGIPPTKALRFGDPGKSNMLPFDLVHNPV